MIRRLCLALLALLAIPTLAHAFTLNDVGNFLSFSTDAKVTAYAAEPSTPTCFADIRDLRHAHPNAHLRYTYRLKGHKGEKCWLVGTPQRSHTAQSKSPPPASASKFTSKQLTSTDTYMLLFKEMVDLDKRGMFKKGE